MVVVLLVVYFFSVIAAESCPSSMQVTGFSESADGLYTQSDQLIEGWPFYKKAEEDRWISYDLTYNHWWLQYSCSSLGVNEGLAWLEGQHACPSHCADQGECQEWREGGSDAALPGASVTASDEPVESPDAVYEECDPLSVDVGHGPGSCNDDCDCPDCAPFCSQNGYCQANEGDGSTPCDSKECYTNDDCYIDVGAYMQLRGRAGCFTYKPVCQQDSNKCYYEEKDEEAGICRENEFCGLQTGTAGDNCPTLVAECERVRQEALAAGKDPSGKVCQSSKQEGFNFLPLKETSAAAGITIQVGGSRTSWTTGSCGSGKCRTRTGLCCKPVAASSRNVCPIYC